MRRPECPRIAFRFNFACDAPTPGESIASAWAGLNASLALLLGSAARTTALQSLALALPTGWTMDALHDVSFGYAPGGESVLG